MRNDARKPTAAEVKADLVATALAVATSTGEPDSEKPEPVPPRRRESVQRQLAREIGEHWTSSGSGA